MSSLITILEDTLSANLLRLEDGNKLSITVSIGASHYPEDGANADELYKRADERMYRMKKDAMPNTKKRSRPSRWSASNYSIARSGSVDLQP
ncbi:diguanylate cyclase [Paenibacillus sp. WQ 127069]|uniref:Diguanylate cyclase n=2 Tax=Paenibacillus TaxID=44249 RepID=A0ABT2UN23_9BACL|nr:diguanylate cyclase [Paenibacillus sp. WQ 127069]MCU6796051.1 diguanylate cyclase [Paenibacillus sp. WQ 127069]